MEVTINDTVIQVVSAEASGYKNVHIYKRVTTSDIEVYNYDIVDSISSYTVPTDGYYVIVEIVLPTSNSGGYYTDGTNIFNSNDVAISVDELLAVSTEVGAIEEDYIITYFLDTKLFDMLNERFQNDICGCGCGCSENYMTDIFTMGMTLIGQLKEYEQYYEIERVIEHLSTCVGIDNSNCNCHG